MITYTIYKNESNNRDFIVQYYNDWDLLEVEKALTHLGYIITRVNEPELLIFCYKMPEYEEESEC